MGGRGCPRLTLSWCGWVGGWELLGRAASGPEQLGLGILQARRDAAGEALAGQSLLWGRGGGESGLQRGRGGAR